METFFGLITSIAFDCDCADADVIISKQIIITDKPAKVEIFFFMIGGFINFYFVFYFLD